MFPKFHKIQTFISFAFLILCSCSSPTQIPTNAPIPPTPTQLSLIAKLEASGGMVSIGDRSMYLECEGEGSPTVIFESGLGLDHSSWAADLTAVSKWTLACSYDRIGLGMSDKPTKLPRTSQDMVEELHTLLKKAGIPGPYLLVGHSLGGINIRLFASQYPEDVVGLVFVESSHPDQIMRMCGIVPQVTPGEDPLITQARADCEIYESPKTDWIKAVEGLDFPLSLDQARQTGPFGNLPLLVLTAQNEITAEPGTVQAIAADLWKQEQQDLVALSTYGKYQVIENADHLSILNQPATYNAIIDMVKSLQEK